MKLQPDRLEGVNVIARQMPGVVWVNQDPWRQSVVVPWRGTAEAWMAVSDAGDLSASHFESLLRFKPEIVIFGSGVKLQFVSPALHQALHAQRVGIETMDTAAACRTYNVLATEGRSVVAALMLP
jgi:uncharacterized protein